MSETATATPVEPNGEQIRQLRVGLGWSQAMLGRVLGVNRFSIRRYELGQSRMSPLVRRQWLRLLSHPDVLEAIHRKALLERAGTIDAVDGSSVPST